MQFTPDTRNMGGRSLILSQLWGHRVCLQQIKERHLKSDNKTLLAKKPDIQQFSLTQRILDKNMDIHKRKLQNIQECLTERNRKEPSYFFRRLPSPVNLKSLITKPSTLKSKSTQEKPLFVQPPPQIDLKAVVPQSSQTLINWEELVQNLHGPQYPLKKWLKDMAIKNRIFDESDFAILIRILMQCYHLKQTTLVSLVAEIIEDLEK